MYIKLHLTCLWPWRCWWNMSIWSWPKMLQRMALNLFGVALGADAAPSCTTGPKTCIAKTEGTTHPAGWAMIPGVMEATAAHVVQPARLTLANANCSLCMNKQIYIDNDDDDNNNNNNNNANNIDNIHNNNNNNDNNYNNNNNDNNIIITTIMEKQKKHQYSPILPALQQACMHTRTVSTSVHWVLMKNRCSKLHSLYNWPYILRAQMEYLKQPNGKSPEQQNYSRATQGGSYPLQEPMHKSQSPSWIRALAQARFVVHAGNHQGMTCTKGLSRLNQGDP